MSIPFHYVDLRAFAYATEDDRRVEDALRTLLPEDAAIDRVESEGHHGDRILVLSARVENADGVRTVFEALSTAPGFDRVLAELDDRVNDNNALHLRVDKQAAYRGDVRLGEGITVRAKVEAYPAKRPRAVANAEDALAEYADDPHAVAGAGEGDEDGDGTGENGDDTDDENAENGDDTDDDTGSDGGD